MNNIIRNGNFTSSEIFKLMSKDTSGKKPGEPYHTYIEECNMERNLGRSLTDEVDAFATSWGTLVERRAFDLLPTQYRLCSQETYLNPEIDCHAGSPDVDKFYEESHLDAIGDIKCPSTLKSFCQLVQPLYDGRNGKDYFDAIRFGWTDQSGRKHKKHKDGEKFYWQLVSNAYIRDRKYAELIIYAPYQSELAEIRLMAEGNSKYYRIWSSSDDQLPFLVDGGYYKNINIAHMQVPEVDKEALRDRILLAQDELIQVPQLVIA
jgi:hypothetical protein